MVDHFLFDPTRLLSLHVCRMVIAHCREHLLDALSSRFSVDSCAHGPSDPSKGPRRHHCSPCLANTLGIASASSRFCDLFARCCSGLVDPMREAANLRRVLESNGIRYPCWAAYKPDYQHQELRRVHHMHTKTRVATAGIQQAFGNFFEVL